MRLLFSVRTLFRGGEEAGFRIPRQALTTQVTARTREAQASLERIARKDQETRAFLSLEPQDKVLKRVASSLAQEPSSTAAIPPHDLTGRLLAVKDNICIQGLPTTCSSNALHGKCFLALGRKGQWNTSPPLLPFPSIHPLKTLLIHVIIIIGLLSVGLSHDSNGGAKARKRWVCCGREDKYG